MNIWDITEHTLSSVYTFYDPAYASLSLGHVTAVREMEYMRMVKRRFNPGLRYYYMGFYVHGCQKSIYKAHMHPQNLLCPFTYTYVPLTKELQKRIEDEQFFRLGPAEKEQFPPPLTEDEELRIRELSKLYYNGNWLYIQNVSESFREKFTEKLLGIARMLGAEMFFKLSLAYF